MACGRDGRRVSGHHRGDQPARRRRSAVARERQRLDRRRHQRSAPWSTMARSSSGSPAWATASIPIRDSPWSASTGQYGRPGLMAAFDARTGRLVWRWNVTGPGWEGAFAPPRPTAVRCRGTWRRSGRPPAHADAWRYGGGSIYATPVVDAAPDPPDLRHRQSIPRRWPTPRARATTFTPPRSSRSTSGPATGLALPAGAARPVGLRRRQRAGAARPDRSAARRCPAVAQASKTGWVFVHDRRDGRLLFRSRPFVPQRNLFMPPPPGDGVVIAPGIAGGANWSPSAYDPGRRLFFVGRAAPADPLHRPEGAAPGRQRPEYASTQRPTRRWGTLTALDLGALGELRWQVAPRSRWSAACSRRRAGWCSAGPAGASSPPSTGERTASLVLAMRRRGERAASDLSGRRPAGRRRRRRRQRAVRLQAGRP